MDTDERAERKRKYMRQYNRRPEVKERNREWRRTNRLKYPEWAAGKIRKATALFEELVRLNPEKASRIKAEILSEDGPEVAEILTNGILERIEKDEEE